MSKDFRKVYEGEEIVRQLQTRYYFETFLAKITLDKEETYEYGTRVTVPYPGGGDTTFHLSFPAQKKYDIWYSFDRIHKGETYIVTMYNTFHQQFIHPYVTVFNFNCTRKEMLAAWRYDQTNYGNYSVMQDLLYTENGEVDWDAMGLEKPKKWSEMDHD